MKLRLLPVVPAVLAAIALLAANVVPSALAGPGHDHGHDHAKTNRADGPSSPRFYAESQDYELVGILKDGELTLYLDRRADTEPVRDAAIELIVDGQTEQAQPTADGTYKVEAQAFKGDGEIELIATITHAGNSDLLVGALKIPHAQAHDQHDDHYDHDHAVHHAGDGAADHSALPKPIADTLKQAGVLPSAIERKFSNGAFLAGLGLIIGLLVGALMRSKSGVTLAVFGLVAVLGAGFAWAGPGHDHGDGGGSARTSGDAPRRMSDGVLFLPKPTQRLLNIRSRILQPETTRATTRLIGRVIADPNRAGLVQSTIGGRIKPTDGGLPTLGRKVKAGEILAYVEPAFAPIDASDVRQTAGDLRQQITLINARIRRQQRLVDRDVASRANLEDLKIELEGLEKRYAELKNARNAPEALTAPVDGVIAEVQAVSGQVVESGRTILHILDPSSLWVEAISYDPGISVEGTKVEARNDDGEQYTLDFVGRSRALQQQAVRFQFKIENPDKTLHIGSPIKVLVETGAPIKGLIVPRSAIAQAPNGQMVVFKRLEPERYQPKPVRFDAIDVDRVHVTGGLQAGDQIIERGAALVNQIR